MRADTAKYAYPVMFMCAHLGVSKSGYYEWRKRSESATSCRRQELTIADPDKAFDLIATAPTGTGVIHAQLARWGQRCSPELVRALMRQADLVRLPADGPGGRV